MRIYLTIVLIMVAAVATAQEPQYGEYIDLPGSGHPADPTVIAKDGTWYLYPTNSGVSVECWTSTDLETWTYAGVVWGPAPPGAWNDASVWAPDVWKDEDTGDYYLYYTANNKIGVAVADNPLGPFVDVDDHPLIGGGYADAAFAIDANMFRDDDGSLYLYATAYVPIGSIRVFPMSDPVTVGGPWTLLLVANPFAGEGVVNEGPWMMVHEGVYYLTYSKHGANTPFYGISYATSDHPMGPFTKYERNPILETDWDREFFGPGHHSVTVGPDGELWMFYHTKLDSQVNWDRRIRKNRIAFTGDGQLYVDLGTGEPPPLPDDDDDDATDDDDDDATDDDTSDDDMADDDASDDDTADDDTLDDDADDDAGNDDADDDADDPASGDDSDEGSKSDDGSVCGC